MWLWIRHWRDWVMNNFLPKNRIPPQQALHFSYEKAGLRLENQPIAWNADAVVVEAQVKLPPDHPDRAAFTLRIPGRKSIPAESLRPEEKAHRLFFRFSPPPRTTVASLYFNEKSLGQISLPVFSKEEFFDSFSLQMPTVMVNLGSKSIACQTFVSTQSKGIIASAMVSSLNSLAPILDLGLHVEFRSERKQEVWRVPVEMASSQLMSKKALVSVSPHKLPKRNGPWKISWLLDEQPLFCQKTKAITPRQFEKSIRISETRYVFQDQFGEMNVTRYPPEMGGIDRLGPCFLLSSSESGMAAFCKLQTRAIVPGAIQSPLLAEQELLITDGPTPFLPGTLTGEDLSQVTGFELLLNGKLLGILPMTPAPTAKFNSEGGFKPAPNFTWSSAADDQLLERLSNLIGGGNGGGEKKGRSE